MRLTLPPALEAWIDRALPELGGVSTVPIDLVDRLPLPLGADGRTLGRHVYLRVGAPGVTATGLDYQHLAALSLLLHELVHVEQFRPWGPLWWAGYALLWWRWEPEARARSTALTYQYQADDPLGVGPTPKP